MGFAASKTVSNVRRFKRISDEKIRELKQQKLKKRTFSKVQWAVKAFKDWRKNKLETTFDGRVYECDLDRVELIEKDTFEYAMCIFLAEVTKVKDGSEYPGKTLYQLVVSIQKHLNINGKKWKLIENSEFGELRNVLDNLMKERALKNVGTTKRQAEMISFDVENKLWSEGVLGEENPDQLRNTVLFLIGLNVGLRAGDEHYALHRDTLKSPSQFSFKRNEKGVRCLVYQEDTTSKTNDGGINHMRKERKTVWVYPSENSVRCPVRLIDKYISLLPPMKPNVKKANFYLQSLEKFTPAQWYGEQVVGLNSLKKVVSEMFKTAKLDGFFTNHSLRRTGTTRLFREGIDRKLVKEFTGHSSDAVDQYQVTSDQQREQMSKVIAGPKSTECSEKDKRSEGEVELSVTQKSDVGAMACSCNKKKFNINQTDQVGSMIREIMETRRGSKTKIKLEIEFSD